MVGLERMSDFRGSTVSPPGTEVQGLDAKETWHDTV